MLAIHVFQLLLKLFGLLVRKQLVATSINRFLLLPKIFALIQILETFIGTLQNLQKVENLSVHSGMFLEVSSCRPMFSLRHKTLQNIPMWCLEKKY